MKDDNQKRQNINYVHLKNITIEITKQRKKSQKWEIWKINYIK